MFGRPVARAALALVVGVVIALGSGSALAQSASEIEDAKAAAAAAEKEAERAQEAARAARERADALETSRKEAEAREAEQGRALKDAQVAAEEARRAAAQAQAAAAEARDVLRAFEKRYSRSGLYLGGNIAYAAENIDDGSVVVNSSVGAGAWLGYRITDYFSIELRGEATDGFDVKGRDLNGNPVEATYETQAYTFNFKGYLLQKSFQPYLSFGFGALHATADVEYIDINTSRKKQFDDSETGALVRFSGGIDYYLSENLVVNLDAAYLVPSGDVDFLEYALLGAGVSFRF